jgi:hypothetical protein
MNTLLSYPDYAASAAVLDTLRLGKQVVEIDQILAVLGGERSGYRYHPAVAMWRGHTAALAAFGAACAREWTGRRARTHASGERIFARAHACVVRGLPDTPPPWWEDPAVFASYRSALLRKGWEDALYPLWAAARTAPPKKSAMTPRQWDEARAWQCLGDIQVESFYEQYGWTDPMAARDARGSLPYVWPDARGEIACCASVTG